MSTITYEELTAEVAADLVIEPGGRADNPSVMVNWTRHNNTIRVLVEVTFQDMLEHDPEQAYARWAGTEQEWADALRASLAT